MTTTIYTPKQLLSRVRQLPEYTAQSNGVPWPASYDSHRAHWTGWLREYDGEGYYGRSDSCRRDDARLVYNRVQNVGMVIWLNEAAGIAPGLVHGAVLRATSARGNVANQTAAARAVLPWLPLAKLLFR